MAGAVGSPDLRRNTLSVQPPAASASPLFRTVHDRSIESPSKALEGATILVTTRSGLGASAMTTGPEAVVLLSSWMNSNGPKVCTTA
jgi:hypothetical protein